jgi:hypothetical protein
MSSFTENAIYKWWSHGVAVLFAATPLVIVLSFPEAVSNYLATQAPETTPKILAFLLLTTTALLAYTIIQQPWLKWDAATGTWLSRLTKNRYCAKCKAEKIITPLRNDPTGWRCMKCSCFFQDPSRIPLELPKKRASKSSVSW